MGDSPSHRWRHFSVEEQRIIQAALADVCEQIVDNVRADTPVHVRREGALAFLTAHEVLFSVDDHQGRAHPPQETVALVASAIMDGDEALLREARVRALGEVG